MSTPAGGAPAWALEKAQAFGASRGETILAVWVASDKNAKNAVLSPISLLMVPPFWIQAIILSPCLCPGVRAGQKIIRQTVFVLTDKHLFRLVDTAGTGVGQHCTTFMLGVGTTSGGVPLEQVRVVSDRLEDAYREMDFRSFCSFFPTEQVVLALPDGHELATHGARKHHPHWKMVLFTDEPKDAIASIGSAKQGGGAPVAQAEVMVRT